MYVSLLAASLIGGLLIPLPAGRPAKAADAPAEVAYTLERLKGDRIVVKDRSGKRLSLGPDDFKFGTEALKKKNGKFDVESKEHGLVEVSPFMIVVKASRSSDAEKLCGRQIALAETQRAGRALGEGFCSQVKDQ